MLKLQGTITAMVTPFDANDNVDYGALRAFVDWQCENGVERLARHPNVVAIKEAAGSVERVSAIKARCPDFTVLSGDDSLVLPMVSVGASGVISVASNVIPKEMGDFVRTALAGDMAAARALHLKYYPLFHDLFIDTNPIMVKEALVMMKKIGPGFLLPLCETTPEKRGQMRATLAALGLV